MRSVPQTTIRRTLGPNSFGTSKCAGPSGIGATTRAKPHEHFAERKHMYESAPHSEKESEGSLAICDCSFDENVKTHLSGSGRIKHVCHSVCL